MNRKIRWQVLTLVLLAFLMSVQLLAGSYEAAYQKYVDAYKAYQTAVSSNLSKAETDKALSQYKSAKAAYEQALNGGSTSKAAVDTTSSNASAAGNATTNSAAISEGSDAERSLATLSAALPAQLKPLLEIIRNTTSKDQANSAISALEKYLVSDPASKFKDLLQYEIASTLDRLDIDRKKAEMLFTNISKNSRNALVSTWAKLGLKYLKAKQYKTQWHTVLNNKFTAMTDAFNKYKNTSWLAFPVKAVRGTTYLAKSVSYIKTQNDHEDFLLAFESAQAPFVTSVDDVFEQYQTSNVAENADEAARIRLIYNNYTSWYARWKVLNAAKSTLDIQYFIIENDAFGLGLLGMCLKKAREGVNIRLMVDVRGSNKLSLIVMAQGYLSELARFRNVQVKVYNPLESNLLGAITDIRRIISSNHDKILIADGRYSIIGGRNIADEYLVDPIDDANAWRDTDLLIDSALVSNQLQKAFEEEFEILKAHEIDKPVLGLSKYRVLQMEIGHAAMDAALNLRGALPLTKNFSTQSSILKKLNAQLANYKNMTGYPTFNLTDNSRACPVHILDSNSLSGPRNDITENIVRYIDGSRREIVIQNPYVVLTPRAEAALKRASRRGVPIIVHTNSPQTSDSFPTEAMLYRDWRSILKEMPTMRMFARINERQLHGKNFVFDSKIGVVGTYNFDFLSEKVNSEVVAVINSVGFANELHNEIMFDINKAAEYHLATADQAEFGPGDVDNAKKLWLIKILSKMGWLKPLF
ncbi:MAG: hypothetical protein EOM80_10960 [Erysipelotrichia bacterium]|nr:hypothetical protein [Erysipelotrichia bacterium]